MTLPEPPLPTFRQLARALFPTAGPVREAQPRPGAATRWYGTGSEALAAAIQALGRGTVWFPAYFCNDALRFVRRLSIDLRFYDVQPDLSINWQCLDRLIGTPGTSHVLVLVHYFGFPNGAESAAAFCKERTLALVEDAAHALARAPGMGCGNAVIFSPRKLLAVPRGGLVMTEEDIAKFLPQPTTSDSSQILSWALRRLMQRALTTAGAPWHFLNAYRHPPLAESEIPKNNGFTGCSPYIRRLISVAERDLQDIIAARRAHYLQLLKLCESMDGIRPMFLDLPQEVCPYVFPVHVRSNVQRWVDVLRSKGVPASRWPDLPPEVQGSRLFSESMKLAEHTVLLPVHQSLTQAQVERMGRMLRS